MGNKYICVLLLLMQAAAIAGAPQTAPAPDARRPNVLIIGASSLVGQAELLGAMLESKGIPMNVEDEWVQLDKVSEMLKAKPTWDYVIMDAWHFGKGRTDPPDFPRAVTNFVKEVRAYSPNCRIILFSWWLPSSTATNADVMEVFNRCVGAAKPNKIWVATTGPAFTEARLARPDLQITRSKSDAHPGYQGSYLNACSLFAAITGQNPVGLPTTLTVSASGNFPPLAARANHPAHGTKAEYVVAPDAAKYLQELAWKVYQREIKNVRPAD